MTDDVDACVEKQAYFQSIFASPLARFALYASVASTLVSVGLNISAALDMRADIGTLRALLLALGSGALGVLAPLAFLAATQSAGKERRQAFAAGVVLLIFNLSTAIGTAEHGRSSLVSSHDEATNNAAEWTRQRNEKAAALEKLPHARAAGELRPQITTLKMTPGANNCEKVDGPTSTKICKLVSELESEIAREGQRKTLQNEIATLSEKLSHAPAANADPKAAAISWLAALIGVNIAEDDVGRSLSVLLAVALEIASSFGLTISFSLAAAAPARRTTPLPKIVVADEPLTSVTPAAPHAVAPKALQQRAGPSRASKTDAAVIEYIRRSGSVRETQRTTAEKIGLPKSSVGAAILRLRARGVLLQAADGGLELAGLRVVGAAA